MKVAAIKILVVEDEFIIASNIQRMLERMKYYVTDICSRSNDVLPSVQNERPDVVLMDIRIDGDEDGVSLAEKLRDLYNLPVVYLSGLMDDQTLERAKITQPFGYIAKPFSQRELEVTLEIALYKAEMERKLSEQEIHIQAIVDGFPQGFCLVDQMGRFRYVNRHLTTLIGRPVGELQGLVAGTIIELPNESQNTLYAAWRQGEAFETRLKCAQDWKTVVVSARHLDDSDGSRGSFLSVTDPSHIVRA